MQDRPHPTSWASYLHRFHQGRAGITEEILAASASTGQNPYEWLLEAIPKSANLLDLACGSAPLLNAGWKGTWVGVDRSEAELDRARANGSEGVVAAEASALPFENRRFMVVACSMALMLLDPLDACLAEVARVLAPGGTVVLLLPGGPWSLRPLDLYRWSELLLALHVARLRYPNDRSVAHLATTMRLYGMTIVTDERRRFVFPVRTADAAERFVDSLYLPETDAARIDLAYRIARKWIGHSIGVPIRRVRLRLTKTTA
jgi:SAM-dependent methyltransferase